MRKCRICHQAFTPVRSIQPTCGLFACLVAYAERVAERSANARKAEERKVDKARREKLKTRSDWLRDAQAAFNAYIRERDRFMPCICCGLPLGDGDVGGAFDCGHYRSVGSAPHLRFDERNAAGQRKQCNRWGSGRAVDYRVGLIERIGVAAVEELESDQTDRRYSIDALIDIRNRYRAKRKALVYERANPARVANTTRQGRPPARRGFEG